MTWTPEQKAAMDRVASLTAELIRMFEDEPHKNDEDISVYLDHTKARTREIGAELNTLGGWNLMSAAHTVVAQAANSVAARHLDFAWDKIGEWRP
jgi:hypothetical protein